MPLIAAVQMASGPNVNANLCEAERLIAKAAAAGAGLVVLPENFALMGHRESDKVRARETQDYGPIQAFLARQAERNRIWLVGGTIPLVAEDEHKVRASCLLFDDHGRQMGRYDKIHLFDVQVVDSNEAYTESNTIEPGERTVVVDTPFGALGLAVCYDLRFPELFRSMLDKGMEIVALPAAFTAITGKAHWEILLRARAIENLCYVVASAQGGYHANGRETYGDSMIVDPWGKVMERLPRGPGFVLGQVDRDRLSRTRRLFPALEHRHLHCSLN
jgi:nitrilase